MATSGGALIWTTYNDVGVHDTFAIWQGWWMGGFLSTFASTAIVLYCANRHMASWKKRVGLGESWRLPKPALVGRTLIFLMVFVAGYLWTPLNSIIGFSGIMLRELAGPLLAEQKKQLGMVRDSARHLLNLINDVLDISKIEAGQLSVSLEPFDFCKTVNKVIEAQMPSAREKGIALTAEIDPQVGALVSDPRRVEQILINLVNNAVKFTGEGSVCVACTLEDGQLVTRVRDTGPGIEAKDLGRLFKPFEQVGSGLAREHEGTGLGLSISKRLVELLGGEISVESEWRRGSTFTFSLPCDNVRAGKS